MTVNATYPGAAFPLMTTNNINIKRIAVIMADSSKTTDCPRYIDLIDNNGMHVELFILV